MELHVYIALGLFNFCMYCLVLSNEMPLTDYNAINLYPV